MRGNSAALWRRRRATRGRVRARASHRGGPPIQHRASRVRARFAADDRPTVPRPHVQMAPKKSTIAKPSSTKGKAKAKAVVPAPSADGVQPKAATEALKYLQMLQMGEETIAHNVAAIMTGKPIDPDHAGTGRVVQVAISTARRFIVALPDDKSIQAQVTKSAVAEVKAKLAVVAEVARNVGPAAMLKLVPTHRDLHRHVAGILPDYDSAYVYDQGDASSSLSGPGGLKWKTRRTPNADNDPRFPDFW